MSGLRAAVRSLLAAGDLAPLPGLAHGERGVMRALVSLLCDNDELVRWRAVSAIGRIAAGQPELARPLVKRLYWSLNDESGGIGWMSAPALGEIGRAVPPLIGDCVRPLVRYLDEPFLLAGALWAIGRLAPAYPEETREVVPEVARCCHRDDPAVRTQAALALGEIGENGAGRAGRAIATLAGDGRSVAVYRDGELVTKQVQEWAAEALARVQAA